MPTATKDKDKIVRRKRTVKPAAPVQEQPPAIKQEAVTEQPIVPQTAPVKAQVVKSKSGFLDKVNVRLLYLIAGITMLALSTVIVGPIWAANHNNILGLGVVGLFVGGCVATGMAIKGSGKDNRGVKVSVVIPETPKAETITELRKVTVSDIPDWMRPRVITGKKLKPNSLNFYAWPDVFTGKLKLQKMAFEHVENPAGQPRKCLNFNQDFYVHMWDCQNKMLVPFDLPDRKYVDPRIVSRYLNLPSQRKYLRHRESLMKYIGPGLLVVLNIGCFITIIASGG